MPGAKARLRLDGADPINRGLLGFWPLAEGAGAKLLDLTNTRQTSNISGTISRISSMRGKVVRFPTASDFGVVSTAKIVSGLTDWSIALWFQVASGFTTASSAALYAERAASGNDIVGIYGFNTVLGRSNNVFIVMRDDGGTLSNGVCSSTSVGNDGAWHFVVATKSGTQLRLFFDGKSEGSATWSGTNNFTDAIASRLAKDANAASEAGIGNYSGLRLFRRALTPREIARLYADPWAGTARQARTVLYRPPIAYTLDPEPVGYRYSPADVALTYTPAPDTGDTHDGFVRRTRRQRAMDAADRRRREEMAQEALALRLSLEAAMGMAAEVAEEAPQEAIQAATRQAARVLPRLADTRASEALLAAAREAVTALRAAVEEAERVRALAEDDEEVMMLLRAL